MKTALILDVETTGLSDRDEIIELGALLFEYDARTVGRIIETYSGLREPKRPISPGAQAVNGISADMLAGCRLDDQRILGLISTADILIAHNASFDKSFIRRLYPEIKKKTWHCSMLQIAWKQKGSPSRGLQTLAARYHIQPDQAHRALGDCQTVYQLLAIDNHFQEMLAYQPPDWAAIDLATKPAPSARQRFLDIFLPLAVFAAAIILMYWLMTALGI